MGAARINQGFSEEDLHVKELKIAIERQGYLAYLVHDIWSAISLTVLRRTETANHQRQTGLDKFYYCMKL